MSHKSVEEVLADWEAGVERVWVVETSCAGQGFVDAGGKTRAEVLAFLDQWMTKQEFTPHQGTYEEKVSIRRKDTDASGRWVNAVLSCARQLRTALTGEERGHERE